MFYLYLAFGIAVYFDKYPYLAAGIAEWILQYLIQGMGIVECFEDFSTLHCLVLENIMGHLI